MKSKITAVEKDSEFDSKYGNPQTGKLYVYSYTFEDGTEGKANHKTDAPKHQKGSEVEYEAKSDEYGTKITFPQEGGSRGGNNYSPPKNDPEIQKYIIRQSSLERAQEYFDANGYGESKDDKYKQNMQLAAIYTQFVLTGNID